MFSLSVQQKTFFDTFGFLSFPGLMADCIEEITDAFEAVWTERGGGHDGKAHDGHLAELAAKARAEMPEPSRG